MKRPLAAIAASISAGILLGGCHMFGGGKNGPLEVRGPAVADVVKELPKLDLPEVRVPPPSRDDVIAAYQQVYGAVPDARENQAVGKRLADLEMQVGEDRDAAGEEAPYQAAITLYEELLKQPNGEDVDQIVYQLARAYDVVGDNVSAKKYLDRLISEYPNSAYVVESRFRRARDGVFCGAICNRSRRLFVRRPTRRIHQLLAERELHARLVPLQGIAARSEPRQFLRCSGLDYTGRRESPIAALRNCWMTCCA